MNKQKQLNALAELHGFTDIREKEESLRPAKLWGESLTDKCYTRVADYLVDFNAIYSLEEYLGLHDLENHGIRVKFMNSLHSIVARRSPLNKVGTPVVSDVDKMFAATEERCEAILKTFKKWGKDG